MSSKDKNMKTESPDYVDNTSEVPAANGKKLSKAAAVTADKSFKIKDGILIQYKGKDETVTIPI